ncbi:MAG: hypothetical protein GXP48_05850 [Acidobacteria bacterium]|nr:hypothetical protein [Acidobacteriota bacterium]
MSLRKEGIIRAPLMGLLLLVSIALAAGTGPASAANGPKIKVPSRHAVSPPLRSVKAIPPPRKIRLMPEHELPPGLNMPPATGHKGLGSQTGTTYQTFQGTQAMPSTSVNFAGVGLGFSGPQGSFTVNSAPPDTNGDVGLTYYIQWVNTSFAIFDKATGTAVYGPAAGNTLWQSLGGECAADNDGDPIVQYDQMAHRWIMTQFAVSQTVDQNYHQCIAVSQTADPLGAWNLYDYSFATFNDYPKMGVWPDGYYFTYNMFSGNSFAGGEICVYDRAAMIANDPNAATQCFGPFSSYGGLLPSDLDGPDLPPSGSPAFVLAKGGDGASLLLWKLHVDWAGTAASTLTGPTVLPVASFTEACNGGTCIPQPGTKIQLDSLADRLMYRLAYRNFPGDHDVLLVNHSVDGGSGVPSAVRWYEIRNPGSTPVVYQTGTYSPDSDARWMGSIAMDQAGDIALGYSVSSDTTYPSIRYAGQLAGDPLGTLTQGESSIIAGTGSQIRYRGQALSRWGDYSSMSVDPSDDCTFWYTQEYLTQDGVFNWSTRIAAFKFPSCSSCGTPAPAGLAASATGTNVIDLSWGNVSGATEYRVYRSETSGGPYGQIATVAAPATSYSDGSVSGGVTYYYVVTAFASCESGYSNEASATAAGTCALAPTFAGIQSVTSSGTSTCSLDLAWNPATSNCGGAITYSVYRSTASGFTPGTGNQIASGITGTTYTDSGGLVHGTTYYYIVRATDQSNGVEDGNTVEKSGSPTGPLTDGSWAAGAESGDPPMTMSGLWSISSARSNTGADSYFSGYANNLCAALTTPQLTLTAGAAAQLTYATAWDIEDRYDGGVVEVSTDGGATWKALTPVEGYPGTFRKSSNACGYENRQEAYTGTGQLTFTPYTVDLSPYAGQTVIIRWNFSTDGSVTGEGWYVDDIVVTHVQSGGSCTS